MSLFEKLSQKKAEKLKQTQEQEGLAKNHTVEQIAANLTAMEEKRLKISTLLVNLKIAYEGANKSLTTFKNKKEELKQAYEDNKEILAEDGVENFTDMLEANASEPEVRQYRKAGGRGSVKENGEVGETGELYKKISSVSDLKTALQDEMPEIKLNFSNTKKEDEEKSNRDLAFENIDDYLKNLDQELIVLKNNKEEAYLETPEGKRQEILKLERPDYVLNMASLDKPDNFYFNENILKLSDKIGTAEIKAVYTEALTKKLENLVWSQKNKKNTSYSGDLSEEQDLIKNYPDLKKFHDLRYDEAELNKFQKTLDETINHLAEIFKDEKVAESLSDYGIGFGGKESRYNDWSEARIRADRYLDHLETMGTLLQRVSHNKLLDKFKLDVMSARNRDYKKNSLYSPEYYHTSFEYYNKFLDYIKNNTNENTIFVSKDSLLDKFKDNKFRDEIGLANEGNSSKKDLEYPTNLVDKNGGLEMAWSKSSQVNETWEKEQQAVAKLSQAAFESRWTKDYKNYFSRENKTTLEQLDYEKKLASDIKFNLKDNNVLNNPEFVNRKIQLIPGGYSQERVIRDLTSDEEYRKFSDDNIKLKEEIKVYASQEIEKIGKEMGSVKGKLIVFNKQEKLQPLYKRDDFMNDYKNDREIKNWSAVEKDLNPEELKMVKDFEKRREENSQYYKESDKNRLNFLRATAGKNFYLNFKDQDSLNNQVMLFSELPAKLNVRLSEIETILNNLPANEAEILRKREQTIKESELAEKKYQEVVRDNMSIVAKK